MTLFAGSACPELGESVAGHLGVRLGERHLERFPDGEVTVRLRESVRERDVYLLQSTSPPVNEHLVELLAFADACRRASAARITAVVPYFGYARADKRLCRREPITAGMVAILLEAVGISHVLTLDLHTPQIEGFFRIPVDMLTAVPVLSAAVRARLGPDAAVVSPDAGRVRLATEYAERLGLPLIVLHKQRTSGESTHVTHVVGEVRGRSCLIIDDMISTGGTLVEAMGALRQAGADPQFLLVATHGLLVKDAEERLRRAGARAILVTDSVRRDAPPGEGVEVISVAQLLGRAIEHLAANGSLEGVE